jgi:hypothetical protein
MHTLKLELVARESSDDYDEDDMNSSLDEKDLLPGCFGKVASSIFISKYENFE